MSRNFDIEFRGRDVSAVATANKVRHAYRGLGETLEGGERGFKSISKVAKGELSEALLKGGNLAAAFGGDLGGMVSQGLSAMGVMEGMAGSAGLAVGAVGGLAAVAAVGTIAAMKMTSEWARTGDGVSQASRLIGIGSGDLQRWRVAAEEVGLTADQMDGSLTGLSSTLQDAFMGRNQQARVVLERLGVQVKKNKDGTVDYTAALLDVIGASERLSAAQKRVVAGALGIDPRLLDQTRAQAKAGMAEADEVGVMSPEELKRAEESARKVRHVKARWERAKLNLGAALAPVGDFGFDVLDRALNPKTWQGVGDVMGRHSRVQRAGGWLGATPFAGAAMGAVDLFGEDKVHALGQTIGRETGSAIERALRPITDFVRGVWSWMLDSYRSAKERLDNFKERGKRFIGGLANAPGAAIDWLRNAAHNVRGGLAARLMHQESRGNQLDRHGRPLTSPKGAIGVMQMLPNTARLTAQRLGIAFDDHRFRTDAAYNSMLGQAHLAWLLKRYSGNEVLASAAYNAGEDAVDGGADGYYRDKRGRLHTAWTRRFGDPRKGEISDADFAAKIPFKETRDYVAAVVPTPSDALKRAAPVEMDVRFHNAPQGMTVETKGTSPASPPPKIAHAMR